ILALNQFCLSGEQYIATSPMFKNLRVVDPTVSEKTRLNLERIIELSGLLDAEARKMAATEK
ncbi:MAG: hypothetical protein M3R14_04445, partial [Acidobacteriota bacterium]|nr:hypothetical protein [Acidobacteriota bacterium]